MSEHRALHRAAGHARCLWRMWQERWADYRGGHGRADTIERHPVRIDPGTGCGARFGDHPRVGFPWPYNGWTCDRWPRDGWPYDGLVPGA